MHEKVLVSRTRKIFPLLSRFKNFYLVGGTALALQIGHRVSIDFDLFTDGRLPSRLLQDAKRVCRGYAVIPTYRAPEQLNLNVDGVKMTFFSYPYKVVGNFVYHEKVPIISILEIAAMKAHAIGQRLAYKDYVDWYFLLKDKHVTLNDVIAFSEKKFGFDFNPRLFLGQLVSLRDISIQEIHFLHEKVSRNRIEKFLEKEVKHYVRSLDS